MPELSSGVSSAAFHTMIQIGFGVLGNSDRIVASGLAYSVYRYWTTGDAFVQDGHVSDYALPCGSPEDIIQAIHSDDESFGTIPSADRGFQDKMKALVAAPELQEKVHRQASRLALGNTTGAVTREQLLSAADAIMRCMIKVFSATGCRGFFSLHTITALHALKATMQLLEPAVGRQCLAQYWQV